jgi:predicted RNA methylase
MNNYFSTLIPGTQEIASQELMRLFPNTKTLYIQEDTIVYKSAALPQDIKQLRFFNNSFLLIKSFDKLAHNPIQTMINQSVGNITIALREYAAGKKRSVRIMFYEENQGVSIPTPLREKVEAAVTQNRNMWIKRKDASIEVWYLTKRDGTGLIGIRLTEFGDYEKTLQQGELRPQIAHILTLLSEPTPQDTMLDPFAGSGRIPLERTYFRYKEIIAADNDQKLVTELTEKVTAQNKKITVKYQDATNMNEIGDNTITKIITDPPWGSFENYRYDIPTLYEGILKEFIRVLIPQGIMVIITGQKEALEKAIQSQNKLKLMKRYDVLVSGKKAGIYKLIKEK